MVVASGVDQVLERAVDAGEVPGVVALAADDATSCTRARLASASVARTRT